MMHIVVSVHHISIKDSEDVNIHVFERLSLLSFLDDKSDIPF